MFLRCPFPIINSKTFIVAVETSPFASAARSDGERVPMTLQKSCYSPQSILYGQSSHFFLSSVGVKGVSGE